MLKIAYHDSYEHPLREGHRFPMTKYDLLPKQLQHEGTCDAENFFATSLAKREDVIRAHTETYYNKLVNLKLSKSEARATGFPLSRELVDRELRITQGTIDAAKYALQYGFAANIAGGTHHAFSDRGEAFCLINDQAVAAHYLLAHKLAHKILIVDLDVHQGNGTAEIFRNTPEVFTFSMHAKNNYPFEKEISDVDIALDDHTDDATYMHILKTQLPKIIEDFQPDFMFYLCGVDILASDKLGKLSCSLQACKARDRLVLESAYQRNIPVVCSMGGGYSPKVSTIIDAHAITFRVMQDLLI